MQPKKRFLIKVPGGTDLERDTADQVLDVLDDLKNVKGVAVSDLQTGMVELSREGLEELANDERE